MVTAKPKSLLAKEAGHNKRFGIVVSRYHEELTQKLLDGALETLKNHGAKADQIHTVWVPGSFEIPMAARALTLHDIDAVICLGIVIKGETPHDEYIAREAARGVSSVALTSGVPVIFGVLTTLTMDQAKARCGGEHGHKGVEAAEAALQMIGVLAGIKTLEGHASKSGRNVGF